MWKIKNLKISSHHKTVPWIVNYTTSILNFIPRLLLFLLIQDFTIVMSVQVLLDLVANLVYWLCLADLDKHRCRLDACLYSFASGNETWWNRTFISFPMLHYLLFCSDNRWITHSSCSLFNDAAKLTSYPPAKVKIDKFHAPSGHPLSIVTAILWIQPLILDVVLTFSIWWIDCRLQYGWWWIGGLDSSSFDRGSVIVIHSATYLNSDKLLRSTRRKHRKVVSGKREAGEIRQVGQEAILDKKR